MIHAVSYHPTRINLKTGVSNFRHMDAAALKFGDAYTGFYHSGMLLIKSIDDRVERLPCVHQIVYEQYMLSRNGKRNLLRCPVLGNVQVLQLDRQPVSDLPYQIGSEQGGSLQNPDDAHGHSDFGVVTDNLRTEFRNPLRDLFRGNSTATSTFGSAKGVKEGSTSIKGGGV